MSISFDNPNLDARLEGSDLFTATANSTTDHYFTFSHNCLFNGLEIYAWDSNPGDNIDFSIEYEAIPGVWYRYKKFGKNWNVLPNTLQSIVLFPAKPRAGLRARMKYENKGNTDVKFIINFIKFADLESVNPLMGQQGEDW